MYVDTSVVVKLYVIESDTAECEAVIVGHSLASSELLRAEFYSALLAKERAREMDEATRERVWSRFNHDLQDRIHLLPLDGAVVREARAIMAATHPAVPLRTLDALHLATFRTVDAGPLFSRDQRMNAAARHLRLPVAGGT
jgi:predicted nucleic acid-binding protein